MTRPNLFIIGAPKCGTTSLWSWLSQHPEVYMSSLKEPWFFCGTGIRRGVDTLAEYEALFQNCEEARIVGEASVTYMLDPSALPRIMQYSPECRLVILLRNPMELVASWHLQLVRTCGENISSLPDAWCAAQERRKGRLIPRGFHSPLLLDYPWIGALGTQVERVMSIIRESRVHVALLDDFFADPRAAWLRLLRFLEIEDDGRQEFPTENTGYTPRGWVERPIRSVSAKMKALLGLRGSCGMVATLCRSLRRRSREPLPSWLVAEFKETFDPEVRRLEEVTGRDLSAWMVRHDAGAVSHV